MSVYLVGNSMTDENITGAIEINSHTDITKGRFSFPQNDVFTIAVNGGPGSGKGSFEKGAIRELSKDSNNVVILVVESARDIINQLKSEGKLESTSGDKLSELISQEQQRRREVAEHLGATFSGKKIYVIYDRDQANCPVYDCFFKHFNFETETLDRPAFVESFKAVPKIDDLAEQMRELFDLVLIMDPVRHETNYACAHPRVADAPVDETRRESFVMAKELHAALEIGAEFVYGESLVIVPNTDVQDSSRRRETILARVMSQLSSIQRGMIDKAKSQFKPSGCVLM